MAALAILETGALAGSAEFAAVVFSVFGYARAGFNLAIAIRMGTRFVSHGSYLRTEKRQLSCHCTCAGSVPRLSHC